jgi:23S rRNA G2445 N2-methylase RlmL
MIENRERKIKKTIYGTPQRVKITYAAGMGKIALAEIQSILDNLFFPQKFSSEILLLKNEIRIYNIHMSAIIELLLRSLCIADIRLIILERKVVGKSMFKKKCQEIDWTLFLSKAMTLKIKVNSVASQAFHETSLKEILSDITTEYVSDVVSGEDTNETTCLDVNFYKNKLTVAISLAGHPLYKRGYRGILSASAPLREDAAACCIYNALEFASRFQPNFSPHTIIIPFSGTGTFAFEYLLANFHVPPALFSREYALQTMPLFRHESFEFLLKKTKEQCLFPVTTNQNTPLIQCYCIDNSVEANAAFLENIATFKKTVAENGLVFPNEFFPINSSTTQPTYPDDFLTMDIEKIITLDNQKIGNIFIPLNPPYGIRLGKKSNAVTLYKNIADKINIIANVSKKTQSKIAGFILCPDEETWSIFLKNLSSTESETYHFTQGGIDIRVCQFYIT